MNTPEMITEYERSVINDIKLMNQLDNEYQKAIKGENSRILFGMVPRDTNTQRHVIEATRSIIIRCADICNRRSHILKLLKEKEISSQ